MGHRNMNLVEPDVAPGSRSQGNNLSSTAQRSMLIVKNTEGKGRGVFAKDRIARNETVLEFLGPRVRYKDVGDFGRHLQVGKRTFLGPSGLLDDLVNHSCEPNFGLVSHGRRVYLVSLGNISPGEEITFDYSTSMGNCDDSQMECLCGASSCRGVIQKFEALPLVLQKKYIRRGVALPHVIT